MQRFKAILLTNPHSTFASKLTSMPTPAQNFRERSELSHRARKYVVVPLSVDQATNGLRSLSTDASRHRLAKSARTFRAIRKVKAQRVGIPKRQNVSLRNHMLGFPFRAAFSKACYC